MKKFLLITIFSVAVLWGFSQKVEHVEIGDAFIYTISQYSDGSSFTNGFQKESLLYKKGLIYTECTFDVDFVELRNSLFISINSVIPNIEQTLKKSNTTMYVVLLPNVQGKIVDAYVGWNSNFRNLFSEGELKKIIAITKNITLKIRCNGNKSGLQYCYPVTISFLPR